MNMKYWGHCLLFMLGLASVCSCTDSEKIVHYRGIAVDDANGSEGLFLLGYISRKARNFDAVLGVVCGVILVCWIVISPFVHANLAIVFGTLLIFWGYPFVLEVEGNGVPAYRKRDKGAQHVFRFEAYR